MTAVTMLLLLTYVSSDTPVPYSGYEDLDSVHRHWVDILLDGLGN